MKKLTVLFLAFVLLFATVSCTRDLPVEVIEWADFLQVKGVSFYRTKTEVHPSRLDEKLGAVQYNPLSERVADEEYQTRDDEAFNLPIGTVYWSIRNELATQYLAVEDNDQYILYKTQDAPAIITETNMRPTSTIVTVDEMWVSDEDKSAGRQILSLRSPEEMTAFSERFADLHGTEGVAKALSSYDEEFFEERMLVVVSMPFIGNPITGVQEVNGGVITLLRNPATEVVSTAPAETEEGNKFFDTPFEGFCCLVTEWQLIFIEQPQSNFDTARARVAFEDAEEYDRAGSHVLDITEIGDGFFKGRSVVPFPWTYIVYADLGDTYCVGDRVEVSYDHEERAGDVYVFHAITVEPSDFELQPGVAYKPVIYLYPTTPTEVTVQLDYNGTLTHTYPVYNDGWTVTAHPNGDLYTDTVRHPYLFWEGIDNFTYDMSEGFCVKGTETEAFLREKLAILGLNETEIADFLDFWLEKLTPNAYNLISFQDTSYTDNAKLTVTPAADTVIRVFMAFTPLNKPIDIPPQPLTSVSRNGFTVVEWGGALTVSANTPPIRLFCYPEED